MKIQLFLLAMGLAAACALPLAAPLKPPLTPAKSTSTSTASDASTMTAPAKLGGAIASSTQPKPVTTSKSPPTPPSSASKSASAVPWNKSLTPSVSIASSKMAPAKPAAILSTQSTTKASDSKPSDSHEQTSNQSPTKAAISTATTIGKNKAGSSPSTSSTAEVSTLTKKAVAPATALESATVVTGDSTSLSKAEAEELKAAVENTSANDVNNQAGVANEFKHPLPIVTAKKTVAISSSPALTPNLGKDVKKPVSDQTEPTPVTGKVVAEHTVVEKGADEDELASKGISAEVTDSVSTNDSQEAVPVEPTSKGATESSELTTTTEDSIPTSTIPSTSPSSDMIETPDFQEEAIPISTIPPTSVVKEEEQFSPNSIDAPLSESSSGEAAIAEEPIPTELTSESSSESNAYGATTPTKETATQSLSQEEGEPSSTPAAEVLSPDETVDASTDLQQPEAESPALTHPGDGDSTVENENGLLPEEKQAAEQIDGGDSLPVPATQDTTDSASQTDEGATVSNTAEDFQPLSDDKLDESSTTSDPVAEPTVNDANEQPTSEFLAEPDNAQPSSIDDQVEVPLESSVIVPTDQPEEMAENQRDQEALNLVHSASVTDNNDENGKVDEIASLRERIAALKSKVSDATETTEDMSLPAESETKDSDTDSEEHRQAVNEAIAAVTDPENVIPEQSDNSPLPLEDARDLAEDVPASASERSSQHHIQQAQQQTVIFSPSSMPATPEEDASSLTTYFIILVIGSAVFFFIFRNRRRLFKSSRRTTRHSEYGHLSNFKSVY